jgi:hypothetical protein
MKRVLGIGILCLLGACSRQKGPNTNNPEDKVLFDFAQALSAGDRTAAMLYYDLPLRQKLELWDKNLRALPQPAEQLKVLQANTPRLGEAAALDTVGREAWDEVKDSPWAAELAEGKCVSGAPSKDDIGRGIVPKERKEMGPELGAWVYDLRTSIHWSPAFRVNCPKSGSFWVQLAQRKKADDKADPPLLLVRFAH